MLLNNPRWNEFLKDEFDKPYFIELAKFLLEEAKNKTIFPPANLIFRAFEMLNPSEIKVIILGQDPYHGEGQANGLSFSVNKGQKIPPSLRNIFLELKADLGLPFQTHGDLSSWAKEGVFLLNSTLTVEKNKPNSHKDLGWQIFTDKVIELLGLLPSPKVFMLWGSFAMAKKSLFLKMNIIWY